MNIKIISSPIDKDTLAQIARDNYGDMIKGVADLKKGIIALGGELHADAESLLLQNGSSQADLWGFNIYPDLPPEERIEYTSFINIRPSQNNKSMELKDPELRQKLAELVKSFIA